MLNYNEELPTKKKKMRKTAIALNPDTSARLAALTLTLGLSQSEVIRTAIKELSEKKGVEKIIEVFHK